LDIWNVMVNQSSLNELALFAGAGGGILGENSLDGEQFALLNGNPIQQAYCAPDKMTAFSRLSRFGMTFKPLMESHGQELLTLYLEDFHAKTLAQAGKGAGIDGERSGMWREMARIIREVRPKFVFVENSPMLTSRGLGVVLGDLASMGFDARWGVLGAADVGANHQRDRIWIVAKWRGQLSHAQHHRIRRWEQQQESIKKETRALANTRCQLRSKGNTTELDSKTQIWSASTIYDQSSSKRQIPNANSAQRQGMQQPERKKQEYAYASDSCWWEVEPNVGRMADGVAAGVDRLKAIGNGQVPLCAATAWRILSE